MTRIVVPTSPIPHWAGNPDGWVEHQEMLQELANYWDDLGIQCELPEEVPGRNHDGGIDILVGPKQMKLDFKSFWLGLSDNGLWYTWLSPVHAKTEGRKAFYKGKQTEFYVHGRLDLPISQWLVGPGSGLSKSKFAKTAPYYPSKNVTTVGKFTKAKLS